MVSRLGEEGASINQKICYANIGRLWYLIFGEWGRELKEVAYTIISRCEVFKPPNLPP